MSWEDVEDEWTAAIKAAHPARRDDAHEAYAVAMKMVGNRHSKGALVELVTWLLVDRDLTRAVVDAARSVDEAFSRDAPLMLVDPGAVAERKLEALRDALDALALTRDGRSGM